LSLVFLAVAERKDVPGESLEQKISPEPTVGSSCPVGWLDADQLGCFKFLETDVNLFWVEAQQKCESIGGYLAEPSTARVGEFLHTIAVLYADIYAIDQWWIGLTDLGKEQNWIWTYSCQNITETSWLLNSPNINPGNTDDCGLMVVEVDKYWWQDASCLTTTFASKKVAPVCQHERIALCPDDWSEFEGHCYLFNQNAESWQSAETDCINVGGHLASIHSETEKDFVCSIIVNKVRTWLGASDIVTEGQWVWTDGTPWDFVDWTSDQPSNGSGEDCLYMLDSNSFADYTCSVQYSSVCKI